MANKWAVKGLCVVCNKVKIIFTIDWKGGRADACSKCVMANQIGGWSK